MPVPVIDFSPYLPGHRDKNGNVDQNAKSTTGIQDAIPEGSYFSMGGQVYKKSGKQAIPVFGSVPQEQVIQNVPISPQEWNMSGTVVPSEYGIMLNNLTPVLMKNPAGGGINLYQDNQGRLFNDPNGTIPKGDTASFLAGHPGWQVQGGQTYEQALNDTSTPRSIGSTVISGSDYAKLTPEQISAIGKGTMTVQQALSGSNDVTIASAGKVTPPTVDASALPFKAGLTDIQKTQIVNRINRIAAGSPITDTDKANFAFALGPNFANYIPQAPASSGTDAGGSTGGSSAGGSNLPPSANSLLDTLTDHLTNSVINPDTTIDQATIDSYLAQAKQELGPYYKQLFDQAAADLKTGFTRIGEDLASSERTLESKFASDLATTQENYAKRGLTFSTNRNKAERTLAEQTQAAIEAGRQKAYRDAFDLGTKGERLLGSSKFPTDLPNTNEAPTPILNQPGVYAFATPKTTRDLFTPVGGQTGTNEQDELAAVKKRQVELQNNELNYRSLNTV